MKQLARSAGIDVMKLIEEWDDRAQARMYSGATPDDANARAYDDVAARVQVGGDAC